MRTRRLLSLLILLPILDACTSSASPSGPSGPEAPIPIGELGLVCPESIVDESQVGDPVVTQFTDPDVAVGLPPVSFACSPESGTPFAIGTTTVTCTATDVKETPSCSFLVQILPPARLSGTRFLAFGDSITQGFMALTPDLLMLDLSIAYPSLLQTLLERRYRVQDFTVINSGRGGEDSREGLARLPGTLDSQRPDVLLLFEGVNNARGDGPAAVANDLRAMVGVAQARGIDVLIATLTPISNSRERLRPGTQAAILDLNRLILNLANDLGIGPAVDLYTAFGDDRNLLGPDGFHPSRAGQQRIAETFFAAIERFEIDQQTLTH